jgi:hypothetical protein
MGGFVFREEGCEIIIPDSYHELETPARGYLEDIEVQFKDGRCYKLTFLDHYNDDHYRFYFEGQRVVVIDAVTIENIRCAVRRLNSDGYFAASAKDRA